MATGKRTIPQTAGVQTPQRDARPRSKKRATRRAERPEEGPTAITLRKFAGAEQACQELRLALASATHVYYLSVEFINEAELDEHCALLAPWLLPILAQGHGAHVALVLGDSLTRTVYLSRRALRLFVTRSHHPVALAPLSAHSVTNTQSLRPHERAHPSYEQYGPVARLALYQSEAVRAVAERMAADLWAAKSGKGYIVTAPVSLADTTALAASGQPCRVLTFPLPRPVIVAASGNSGPLL